MEKHTAKHHRHDGLKACITRVLAGPAIPEKEFILSGRTYREVYETAATLREAFLSHGGKTAAVCLAAEDKAVIAASVLAALSCGGPRLIIPHAFSEHVLAEMHDMTGYTLAVTDSEKAFPRGVESILPTPAHGGWDASASGKSIEPDRLLLMLFTGGSTGKPKTWSKTARNLLGEALFLSEKHHVSRQDRFVATVPPYHIYGLLFSVLVPFISSSTVLGGNPTFPHEISEAVDASAPTVLVSVPMHYRSLHGHIPRDSSLRIAFSSAGLLNASDSLRFFDQTGVGIVEIYGSTETGGIASRCRAAGEDAFTPFDVVDVRIPDNQILVRSDFISPDVARRPDGWFNTGDRGNWIGDTCLALHGRSDGIVKVGGKRVDLHHIREKLLALSSITDAVIFPLKAGSSRENDIAAVIEGDTDAVTVRQYLSGFFEPYALPRHIKVVDTIPSISTGKYDMKTIERLF